MKKLLNSIPNIYKTMAWNFFYLFLALLVNFLIDNLANFRIPVEYAAIVAVALSGLSKFLATRK